MTDHPRLTTWRCSSCGESVRAAGASGVSHRCPAVKSKVTDWLEVPDEPAAPDLEAWLVVGEGGEVW